MSLTEYTILAFTSLFVILNPVSVLPSFIAMTPNDSSDGKRRMAKLACGVAGGVLMLFASLGQWIFKIMGITLPAFQIAGSILLFRIAMDMMSARRSASNETAEEVQAGVIKDDIAITPLGVPMLAGPGAISTALILLNQARGFDQVLVLYICIAAVSFLSYWIFWLAIQGAKFLSPLALKLMTRLMGLLLATMAVQFVYNALAQWDMVKK